MKISPWPLYFYRLFARPILVGAANILALFNPKIREGLKLRSKPISVPKLNSRRIWFHFASGEFEYAKPVIREWRAKHPNDSIIASYFSPSVRKQVEAFKEIDFSFATPLESASDWSEIISLLKPSALLIARTDLWPEMLTQVRAKNVPILLFSATITEQSGRASFFMAPMIRYVLGLIDQIFCVDEKDKLIFKKLGSNATVQGDTRYDQVLHRLENPKRKVKIQGMHPLLCAGSTWIEDEAVLLPLIKILKGKMQFILAPHEPTNGHLATLYKEMTNLGITHQKLSDFSNSSGTIEYSTDVLIIDQVGILADLYSSCEFAFVGGSFRKTVHSVMEPLAAGCITFVGPKHLNNREALEFKNLAISENLFAVEVVTSAEMWSEVLCKLGYTSMFATRIKELVKSKCGGTKAVSQWIESKLA